MKKTNVRLIICLIIALTVALTLISCSGTDNGGVPNNEKDTTQADNGSQGGATTQGGVTDGSSDPDSFNPSVDIENLPSREEFLSSDRLVIYPELPANIIRSFDYKVTVTQGKNSAQIPVYNHTMEYDVADRSIGGDLYRRFSQFAFCGERVRVDIKVNRDFQYYSVLPSAKDFETSFADGVISVYLDEPDYFGIRLDDDDNSIISIFADLPEYPGDVPAKDGENVIFVDGWYEVDGGLLISEQENTTIYIAPGAVLNARVDLRGANSKVLGRGIILDPFNDFYNYDITIQAPLSKDTKLCMLTGSDCLFDGPVLVDARGFNLVTKTRAVVRNYKALSTMMCSDGITGIGTGSTFEHCWIYVGDNALVISGATNQTYRDIAIGNTCAAIFPQLSTVNVLLENIYVFRTNDGVINNRYNSGSKDRDISITIRNLDCMDCLNIPRFYQGGNMGTLEKTITFDGVSLPVLSGATDPHMSKAKTGKGYLVQFTNPNTIFTENYTLTLNNVYVDGKAITSADQASLSGTEYKNTLNFSNDGNYTPGKRITYEVNYTRAGKVYIGAYLAAFETDVIVDGDVFLLPAEEIAAMLRTDKMPETIEKNGIKYVKSSDLTAVGAAESVQINGGNLHVTPVYAGENLLVPDHPKNSQITENPSYQVDLVIEGEDGDYTYTFYPNTGEGYYTSGFTMMLTEEIKKYGAGSYEFSFRVRASGGVPLIASWRYDDMVQYTKNDTNISSGTSWKDISITLNVTKDMLDQELFLVSVKGTGAKFEYFAIKDIQLIKK